MRRRRAPLAAFLFLAAAPLVGGSALLPILTRPALAQAESREGIFLQNQILQLRQELETLRRSGGGGSALPAPVPRGGGGGAPSGELLTQLLDRVGALEEEVRRMRGRLDEAEFRNRQLSQAVEKLQGDMDFRLQQLEGGGGRRRQQRGDADGAGPASGGLVAGPPDNSESPPPAPRPAPPPAAAPPPPRTPERMIAEGQAALSRRDYAAAEAAARDVLANRSASRAADAQLLLADALAGKRDYAGAALAYNDAYVRGRSGPKAPDALLGLATAFNNLGHKREACDALDDLRSRYPNLRPAQAERAADARRRAGCR
jgi:TolA-binding protein